MKNEQYRNSAHSLHSAIKEGNADKVNSLLQVGVQLNDYDSDGLTPLMIASGYGHSTIVGILLNEGANVHVVDRVMGATALHKAVQSGNAEVIRKLIDQGIFIDQQSAVLGNTALMDAVLYKQAEVIHTLLHYGARTEIRNYWNQNAHELALQEEIPDIVDALADANKKNEEYISKLKLIPAIKSGNILQVKNALTNDACAEERYPIIGTVDDDYSALGIAAREGHAEIVCLLLEAGADPWKPTGLMRGTPLHEAAFAGHSEIISIISEWSGLKGLPSEVNAQGPYNGLTALHDSVWHGHTNAVKALLAAGARVDLPTHAGMTPYLLAKAYQYHELAKIVSPGHE